MLAQDNTTVKDEDFRWVRQGTLDALFHDRGCLQGMESSVVNPLGRERWARWVLQDARGYESVVTYIPLDLEDAIDSHFAMERADCVRADRESYGP